MPSSSAASNAASGGVQEWKRKKLMPSSCAVEKKSSHSSLVIYGYPVNGKTAELPSPRIKVVVPLMVNFVPEVLNSRIPKFSTKVSEYIPSASREMVISYMDGSN